jgi:hypothetical protein
MIPSEDSSGGKQRLGLGPTEYIVLHRPVELAAFIRWDEKAGLQRDAIRSQ